MALSNSGIRTLLQNLFVSGVPPSRAQQIVSNYVAGPLDTNEVASVDCFASPQEIEGHRTMGTVFIYKLIYPSSAQAHHIVGLGLSLSNSPTLPQYFSYLSYIPPVAIDASCPYGYVVFVIEWYPS